MFFYPSVYPEKGDEAKNRETDKQLDWKTGSQTADNLGPHLTFLKKC